MTRPGKRPSARLCAVPRCSDKPHTRGFCKVHYQWAKRHGLKVHVSLPMRIVDVLETDGCWMTIEAVAARLPSESEASVARALHRLAAKGELKSRPVNGSRRREWQLT